MLLAATPSAAVRENVQYGLVEPEQLDAVTRIYLESFPGRVAERFSIAAGRSFYRDLFELMRRRFGSTFFAATIEGRLVGFLLLTRPGKRVWASPFAWQMAIRAAVGKYGPPWRFATAAIRSLTRGEDSDRSQQSVPHVYVVAVDRGYTGLGIGTALLQRARLACRDVGRMWLNVDSDNDGAVRLYERLGFLRLATADGQYRMVWEFGDRLP